MSKYLVLALALVLSAGSAQAVTSFSDDFSSGTLDQWTVVNPTIDIVGTTPDCSAYFGNSLDLPPLMFGDYVLDPGQYQLQFFFMADAAQYSFARFDLYPTTDPGSFSPDFDAWLCNNHSVWVETRAQMFAYSVDLFSDAMICPYGYGAPWIQVNATFAVPDYAFFSMSLDTPEGGMMLLDNFSITPLDGPVPEPTSLALIGCGLAGIAARKLRRGKRGI